MDVLSDVLRVIRLNGAIFLNAEFREPWCVAAPSGAELAREISLPHEHLAVCHLIVEGRCWIRLGEESLAVQAGEAVVFPHGQAHLIGSGLRHAPASEKDLVSFSVPELTGRAFGGEGDATRVFCGWFAYERHIAAGVMSALPPVFRASLRDRLGSAWLESAIRYAVDEAASRRAGSRAVADRLAEVLFVEALRGYMESLPAERSGWLAGLRDPLVGRALALMHEKPAHPWTVAALANDTNVSRTVLAERFAALIGVPPMQYLTQWRIALAANLLRSGRLTLSRIAEAVGYESEAAFNRAFKRRHGMPPAAWRRAAAGRIDGAT